MVSFLVSGLFYSFPIDDVKFILFDFPAPATATLLLLVSPCLNPMPLVVSDASKNFRVGSAPAPRISLLF